MAAILSQPQCVNMITQNASEWGDRDKNRVREYNWSYDSIMIW